MPDSRPVPGPLTRAETSCNLGPIAWREASWATTWATCAVEFFEPRKPHLPADDQPMTLPFMSVIETIVLLNVAEMWAMPMKTFLLPLALTILGFSMSFGSSDRLVEIWSAGLTAAGAEAPFLSPPAFFSLAGFFSALGLEGAPFSATAVTAAGAAAAEASLGATSFLAAGFFA